MLKKVVSTLALAAMSISFVACSSSSGDGVPEGKRAPLDSGLDIRHTNQKLKMKSMSAATISKMLNCDGTATVEKITGDNLYVTGTTTFNSISGLDMPQQMERDSVNYRTNTAGATYEIGYNIAERMVDGKSAFKGPVAFNLQCTRDSGCDPESRRYVSGGPFELLDIDDDVSTAVSRYMYENNVRGYSCSFVPQENEEVESTIQEVEVGFASQTVRGVEIVTTTKVDVYCSSGWGQQDQVHVGESVSTTKQIVLADLFPMTGSGQLVWNSVKDMEGNRMSQLNGRVAGASCDRTAVFYGSQVASNGTVYSGQSIALSDYFFTSQMKSESDLKKAEEPLPVKKELQDPEINQ